MRIVAWLWGFQFLLDDQASLELLQYWADPKQSPILAFMPCSSVCEVPHPSLPTKVERVV
jgi:hypothetical protein